MDMTRDTLLTGAIAFYMWMGIPGFVILGMWLWVRLHRA